MSCKEDLREAIIRAKDAIHQEMEQGTKGNSIPTVAFCSGGYHVGFTSLTFDDLALIVEAAEGGVE